MCLACPLPEALFYLLWVAQCVAGKVSLWCVAGKVSLWCVAGKVSLWCVAGKACVTVWKPHEMRSRDACGGYATGVGVDDVRDRKVFSGARGGVFRFGDQLARGGGCLGSYYPSTGDFVVPALSL